MARLPAGFQPVCYRQRGRSGVWEAGPTARGTVGSSTPFRSESAYTVPFNRAYRTGREVQYAAAALRSEYWGGGGPRTRDCETLLEVELEVPRVLLTTSCTHALELAALLLDLSPGDEVIVPSFTFVSTANAFALRGARIIFCDIHPDTLALDEQQLGALLSSRTRAIVPVHYAGIACEMDTIQRVAQAHGDVAVVEDNAHGLYGKYRGDYLGTFGKLGALSFHATKNFSCGEGGAVIVNDSSLVERAEMVREKGTDRTRFYRGEVDFYSWQVLGSSYMLAEPLAAILQAQLEARAEIAAKRSRLWTRYHSNLDRWARSEGVELPVVPAECEHPSHIFHILLPTSGDRDAFVEHLARRGAQAATHYVPLHSSPAGRRFGDAPLGAPVTDNVASRLVRLPLYPDLTASEHDLVLEAATTYRSRFTARMT